MTAWRCLNKDCRKVFHIAARLSGKPLLQDYTSNTAVEKACCPYCLSIEFEPYEPTTFDLMKLALEVMLEMTNGWSQSERAKWKQHLEQEIKPHYPLLYEFLCDFTTDKET